MHTLLQISDPHFGTEQPPVVEALITLSRSISPDIVVVSGDITQRARRAQFSAARAFIDQLDTRNVLAIPGNHDIPLFDVFARWLHPYRNFSRAFGPDLEPSFEDEDALVMCVNTTRSKYHKDGEVSQTQIDAVAKRLRSATASQLRIVVTHQPVQVIDLHDIPNLLRGYEAAVKAWNAAGADLIMGGHIHLPHVRPLSDTVEGLSRLTWSVQAGTAVSRRVRDNIPNSVNIVRTAFPHCMVERWDYNAAIAAFALKVSYSLELSRSEAA